MKFIDLDKQYNLLKEKISFRIHEVLRRGSFIMGPEVFDLEEKLKTYVGVSHCISCANGTDALQLSLMALGIGSGDKVITTPFTFFATAEAISIVGATPLFIDIDEGSYNISPNKLEEYLDSITEENKEKVKAVIAVDLFGLPADYRKLSSICRQHGLKLIEDGAQSFGAQIDGEKSCRFGDIATTSFFPAKPLGCYGDGGAVFTDSKLISDKVRSLRVHGKGEDKYDNVCIGLNSRLDTLQAGVLLEKMKIFDEEIEKRQNVASYYTRNIEGDFILPSIPNDYRSVWAQYSLRCRSSEKRKVVMQKLSEKNIPTQIYYKKPIHLQKAFEELGYKIGDFKVTEKVSETIFSIPMHPYIEREQQNLIVNALNDCSS
jgi:dTDP-4-amino-4,6-dideoxygalactose transaminase